MTENPNPASQSACECIVFHQSCLCDSQLKPCSSTSRPVPSGRTPLSTVLWGGLNTGGATVGTTSGSGSGAGGVHVGVGVGAVASSTASRRGTGSVVSSDTVELRRHPSASADRLIFLSSSSMELSLARSSPTCASLANLTAACAEAETSVTSRARRRMRSVASAVRLCQPSRPPVRR